MYVKYCFVFQRLNDSKEFCCHYIKNKIIARVNNNQSTLKRGSTSPQFRPDPVSQVRDGEQSSPLHVKFKELRVDKTAGLELQQQAAQLPLRPNE